MIQPKKIFRTTDGKLGIEWNDNSKNVYTIRELRQACPCALCVDEHSGKKILDDSTVPMNIKLIHIKSVGQYAASFTFNDGHNSGIYPYDKLKELTKTV